MSTSFDCIVLGVGGFGSGALYHLARRGLNVLGIERFGVAHDRGSSHGETRIIRKAYFEHPDYVPLLLQAYDLWHELEVETGRQLYHPCGLMLAGPPEGEAIAGAKLAHTLHGVRLEDVPLETARQRLAGFRFPDEFAVVYEPEAGYLEVEACVEAHIQQAVSHGATVHTDESVHEWSSDGRTVRVTTDKGEYEAAALIVTAGAWAGEMLAELKTPLEVVRKPLFWFKTTGGAYSESNGCPAYYFEMPYGVFYGFPSRDGQTLKLAEHSGGEIVADPLQLDRDLRQADLAPVARFLGEVMPHVCPEPVRHAVCMYTLTPDRHFIVDRHPQHTNVVIGAGFSGHGFKFTGVLGQALADLAVDGRTKLPIGFLSLGRDM